MTLLSCLLFAGCATTLHRAGEDAVRERMLAETPIGMPLAQVRPIARGYAKKCMGDVHYYSYGLDRPARDADDTRYLSACVGSGWEFPFRAYTFVHWIFDDADRLVDVEVLQQADAL